MKTIWILLSTLVLVVTGCLFESGGRTVAGGEDFPNTITPLGKVAADDISSNTQWDQFQDIPDPTDVLSSADSLLSVTTLLAKSATASGDWDRDQEGDYTVEKHEQDVDLHIHMKVNGGLDHNLSTKFDNVLMEFEIFRTLNGDTLEWTQLRDSDGDSNGVLWGNGDSGAVQLSYLNLFDPLRPQVERRQTTLQVMIYHRGDSAVLRSYRNENLLRNGTRTVLMAKGVHADSSLRLGDTALVTVDQTPTVDAPLEQSNGRYWVRFGTRPWNFTDNALLHFTIENRWRSGVIRHSICDFNPSEPLVSQDIAIRGSFTLSTESSDGATADVTGSIQGDTLLADMHELRGGKNSNFHVRYDSRGEIKEKERLPD